jgi:hypothetical protein
MGATIDDNDDVFRSTASGQGGGGGADSYAFWGGVAALDVDGDATVYLNGNTIDSERYPDHVLTLSGSGRYTVTATDEIEKTTANNASINGGDSITRTSATGEVAGGRDSYAFSGEIAALRADNDVEVSLDADSIDPASYLNRVLVIEGTGSTADYVLTASSALKKTTVGSTTINSNDRVWDTTARGVVKGRSDSYALSTDVDRLHIYGDARVYLDGQRVDPASFPKWIVTIEGTGSRATYDLAVEGDLEKTTTNGASINAHDTLSGSNVSGKVYGGADSYAFSGAITRLDLDKNARLELDRSENTITVIGEGERVDYRFSVSGSVEPISINGSDTAGSSSANGHVVNARDRYRYSGRLWSITLGGTTVSIE